MLNSSFRQENLPRFHSINPIEIEPTVCARIHENNQKLDELLKQGSYTWANLMHPLEEMHDEFNKIWSPISHLHAVLETDELRKAYNETLPIYVAYLTELSQNEKLFWAINSIANSDEFIKLHPAQQKIIENEIRDFRLSGVQLSPEQKATMADLQKQLSQLMTKFSENVLDATEAWFLHVADAHRLKGLPEQALALAAENAAKRNLSGYVITLDFPSYSAALKFLEDRELRKTLYEAYATRASEVGPNADRWDNTPVMDEILRIRHKIAEAVGFNNYAEYSLATKMAKTPKEVLNFLYDLLEKSKAIGKREHQEVIDLAKKDGITAEAWDLSYYSEKLSQTKFKFTQEDLRPYFPINKVLEGMFAIVNKLFDITIKEQKDIEVWHPDVQFFAIYDHQNELRGGFYIDLYARSHKRDGAWMDECRIRRQVNGTVQYPVAYLTCNFSPAVNNQPALLTHDDVQTLFHEFGHALQHMLTKVDYPSVSGINGIPWDAVEFPSQFMENYCWEKESLDLISGHYITGEPLPDTLYQKLLSAKHFQTALQMLRQIEFALFDFRIHLEYDPSHPGQIQKILDEVRAETLFYSAPHFNRFQHSFSHIFAGSYAAAYYSYKWAEVLSADAYGEFEEKGIFDKPTGLAFLHNILESGGVHDPLVTFIAFRGREPKIDALLKQSGIAQDSHANG